MPHKPTSLVTQSVVLSKDRFKTKRAADVWIRRNDFVNPGVDETPNTWRYRQRDPSHFRPRTYATFEVSDGVQLVSAKLRRPYLSNPGAAKSCPPEAQRGPIGRGKPGPVRNGLVYCPIMKQWRKP